VIPQTVVALAALLFLVAPGIAFQLLRERRRPTVQQTVFREASVVALTSLLFSMAATGSLAAARLAPAGAKVLPDPARWLREGHRYAAANLGRIAGFFIAELVIAVSLAWLAELITGRRLPAVLRYSSLWFRAFREEAPPGTSVFARITVSGGTEYYGSIGNYTAGNVPLNERELELATPMFMRLTGETDPRPLPEAWSRLLIPGGVIEGVVLAYRSGP
jgi:hypothetical protein